VAMNALPPKAEYLTGNFAAEWKRRLEQTPPWLIEWLRQQTDGAYYRNGSLAPDYARVKCAIFHIGGWQDGYTDPVLRMQANCVNAPRKALIGNWGHLYPASGYPGPNLDHLHEMVRFFEYWLKGHDNGVMNEPKFTLFMREWTTPNAFAPTHNGEWRSYADYPIEGSSHFTFHLNGQTLSHQPSAISHERSFPHLPTWGTTGAFSSGGGSPPNGLARDQRPDEALALTFTGEPLTEPLDVIGFPEVTLHVSCTAPVATIVARLCDVHPDGASALVAQGALNLTHRESHEHPAPLTPGEICAVTIPLKATGYRFLPGHRLRLTLGSNHFPLLWPSPYPCEITIHCGPQHPSQLTLPVAPASTLPPLHFKTTPPELITVGGGSEEAAQWHSTEDVIAGSVTVSSYGGDTSILPDGRALTTNERLAMTAFHHDPAHAQLINECNYILREKGYETHVHSSGTFRSTATDFHLDIQLTVKLNGSVFFQKAWLETVPRNLV
ncbi:MAG: CocE/NonD family hydrolase, partial [Anaerolineales bacterium]